MDKYKNQIKDDCLHNFIPLGFEKISTNENNVEVIACIACSNCGLFRTKILYFDRQKDKPDNKTIDNGNNNM